MEGIFVAHQEYRVPSPIHEYPESLQLQKRGNNTDYLPCRYPENIRLPFIHRALDTRAAPPLEDIESCARFRTPDNPGTITDF